MEKYYIFLNIKSNTIVHKTYIPISTLDVIKINSFIFMFK